MIITQEPSSPLPSSTLLNVSMDRRRRNQSQSPPLAASLLQMLLFLLLPSFIPGFLSLAGAERVGVNWGMKGSNLPSPSQVVSLYHSRNITRIRLFNPEPAALDALRSSGIAVILGTLNEDLTRLAADPSFAASWVATNVIPYAGTVNFRYICVGNEVIPGDMAAQVLPAMHNLDAALKAANVQALVTTAVSSVVIGVSYPPSQATFSDAARETMAGIATFLAARNTPLLANIYPYFAYAGDSAQIPLEYALLTSNAVVVKDGSFGYTNLFDAMVDSVYAALEKVGAPGVEVVVSETGWPSGGGDSAATVGNAMTYNNRVVARITDGTGTPRRASKGLEVYLFAMFNENEKPAGTEQYFGMYMPDMSEVYHVNFST